MSIALKLKQAVASFASAAVIASAFVVSGVHTPEASAAFDDVTNQWFAPYVTELEELGIVEGQGGGNLYDPSGRLTRAAAVKLVVEATGGIQEDLVPATATYTDVASDAWYYDYVETASALGIVNGYVDDEGNLTGIFDPAKDVSRAEFAKMTVEAFELADMSADGPSFPDVASSAWYYEYVETAYMWSVIDGNPNGDFDPNKSINRAAAAKMIVGGMNPVVRIVDPQPCDPEEDDNCIVNPGNSDSDAVITNVVVPAMSDVPKGATRVSILEFDVTAEGTDPLALQELSIEVSGPGDSDNIENIYLVGETGLPVSGERSFNEDNVAELLLRNHTILAGETETFQVMIDVDLDALTGSQHTFTIHTEDDLVHNGEGTEGDFPMVSDEIEIGAVTVSTATFTVGSSLDEVFIGQQDAPIATFRIAAGDNDIELAGLTLENEGSVPFDELTNGRLYRGNVGDELLATTQTFEGDYVRFNLETTIEIPANTTKTFTVSADITGGEINDIIELDLPDPATTFADLLDMEFDFNAQIIDDLDPQEVVIDGGKINVVGQGPLSTDIPVGSSDVVIQDFDITSVEGDAFVQDTFIEILLDNPNSANNQGPDLNALSTEQITSGVAPVAAAIPSAANPDIVYTAVEPGEEGSDLSVLTTVGGLALGGDSSTIDITRAGDVITVAVVNDTQVGSEEDVSETGITNCMNAEAGSTEIVGVDADGNAGNTTVTCNMDANAAGVISATGGQITELAAAEANLPLVGGADGATNDTAAFCVDNDPSDFRVGDALELQANSGEVFVMVDGVDDANASCGGAGFSLITTTLPAGDGVDIGSNAVEFNPYDEITSIKLVDVNKESTLISDSNITSNVLETNNADPDTYSEIYSDEWDLKKDETRNLSIMVNLSDRMPVGYAVNTKFQLSDPDGDTESFVEDTNGDKFATEDIVTAGTVALFSNTMFTADYSLNVVRSNGVVSTTYVEGVSDAPMLGLSMTAGDAGNVLVTDFNARLYANTDIANWTTATGNLSAGEVFGDVFLYYEGEQIADAGPVLVDANQNETFDVGEYYVARFTNMANFPIDSGETESFEIRADIVSDLPQNPVQVAVDIDPQTDIEAEANDGNNNSLIIPTGDDLNIDNGPDTPPLDHLVGESGTLQVTSVNNLASNNIILGSETKIGSLTFKATFEDIEVDDLDVSNDVDGGIFDNIVAADAVKEVYLRWEQDGESMEATGVMNQTGTAPVSDMNLMVPADSQVTVDVYVKLVGGDQQNEQKAALLSGELFRLGLNDQTGNFEADGLESGEKFELADVDFVNMDDPNLMIVRDAVPVFSVPQSNIDENFGNGNDEELYRFEVAANGNSDVTLARFVLDVNISSAAGLLDDFQLRRNGEILESSEVNIFEDGTTDIAPTGGNTLGNGATQIIISFVDQETVNSDGVTYTLIADTNTDFANDDTVTVSLAQDDENELLTDLTGTRTGNDGKVHAAADTESLMDEGGADEDFAGEVAGNNLAPSVAIIWSDQASLTHEYPELLEADADDVFDDLTIDSGSDDFTNGVFLDAEDAGSRTVEK